MAWTRKKKKYRRPRKIHDSVRMKEESQLIEAYGLKNKREIWKADAAIGRIRNKAKKLTVLPAEEQEKLFGNLNKIGLNVKTTADVLGLDKEDWLKRRLQSVLVKKNFAKPKEARQLIVHKHVVIGDRIVNIPGYIVKLDEEDKIKIFKKEKKQEEKVEEVK